MSNFKVNSKSTILEFKRKHNKLVDKTGNIPNVENAQSGTIASGGVLGLNSQGKVVKGSISGGTQLYKHTINCESPNGDGRILEIVSLSSSPISVNVQNVYSLLINSILFSLFNTEEEPMELIITNNNVSSIDILISEDRISFNMVNDSVFMTYEEEDYEVALFSKIAVESFDGTDVVVPL